MHIKKCHTLIILLMESEYIIFRSVVTYTVVPLLTVDGAFYNEAFASMPYLPSPAQIQPAHPWDQCQERKN